MAVDHNGVDFWGGGRRRVRWNEVVFARRDDRFVSFGTASGGAYALDSRVFGGKLWEEISKRVPPSALDRDAYTHMPGHVERAEQAAHALDRELAAAPSMSITLLLWVGFLGFGAGAAATAVYLREDFPSGLAYWGVLGTFSFFAGLSLIGILTTGRISLSSTGIRYSTPLGLYAMNWTEVTGLATDAQNTALVFRGNGKRLVTLGPTYWRGRDREATYPALIAFLAQRGITVGTDTFAAFKIPRGCRVPSSRNK